LVLFSPGSAQTDFEWEWEIKHLFNGKLSQKYSHQKLLQSNNSTSSYNRKGPGCFFETQCSTAVAKWSES